MTADEVRAEKHKAMGPELGEMHYLLTSELTTLWLHWKDLLELFGKDQQRIDLLNEAAGAFFGRLEYLMWSETMLHLCRITDPPITFGKGKVEKFNLTVRALPTRIADDALRGQVEAALPVVEEETKFARDWRNRRLAHQELPPLDGSPSKPLESANRGRVDAALKVLSDVLNRVEVHYLGHPLSYESAVEAFRGPKHLVYYLEKGLVWEREFMAAGRPPQDVEELRAAIASQRKAQEGERGSAAAT